MNNVKWFWLFIKTRKNWVLWFLFLNLMMLGISYIDYDISVDSMIYLVVLNIGMTTIFLLFAFLRN